MPTISLRLSPEALAGIDALVSEPARLRFIREAVDTPLNRATETPPRSRDRATKTPERVGKRATETRGRVTYPLAASRSVSAGASVGRNYYRLIIPAREESGRGRRPSRGVRHDHGRPRHRTRSSRRDSLASSTTSA